MAKIKVKLLKESFRFFEFLDDDKTIRVNPDETFEIDAEQFRLIQKSLGDTQTFKFKLYEERPSKG